MEAKIVRDNMREGKRERARNYKRNKSLRRGGERCVCTCVGVRGVCRGEQIAYNAEE